MQFKQPIGELISHVLKMYLLTGMMESSGCILRPAISFDDLLPTQQNISPDWTNAYGIIRN